jgi:two-component system CitB family sensor kinase
VLSRRWSLARQLLALQVAVVVVLVGAGLAFAYSSAAGAAEQSAREEVTVVAATVADTPSLREALHTADPSALLQPFAEQVRADTGVDFITIMRPDGIRYTHPNPAMIGKEFIGNRADALAGRLFTETYTGTLGPSVRAVAPVPGRGEQVVALVAVGITIRSISGELADRLPPVFGVGGAALLVGVAGSWLISARLRRQTRGIAPAELSHMFDYHEAVLHSVREGLVLVGADERVVLCNDAARELLGLSEEQGDIRNLPVTRLGLAEGLAGALTAARPRTDEIHVTDSRVLLVNTVAIGSAGGMGNVVTLRDHTELQALSGELDTVRGFTESLRAQAHESANRLHTVVSLVELGRTEQAVEFATAELATAQQLTDRVVGAVSEPVLAALLLGKSSEASERGVEFVLTEDTALQEIEPGLPPRDLVTVLGNLIDNALDAAVETSAVRSPRVEVTVRNDADGLLLRVADSGPGVDSAVTEAIFRRGWSTKTGGGDIGHGLGLALAGQVVRRHGGDIEVGTGESPVGTAAGAVFSVRLPFGGTGAAT